MYIQLHLGLDPEVISSLDNDYSVARVATKVAWYILFMRCSRGGASGRSVSGGTGWMVGRVCGRGLYGYMFVKGVLLGCFDTFLLGWVNGCELGSSDKNSLGNYEWTPDQQCGSSLIANDAGEELSLSDGISLGNS